MLADCPSYQIPSLDQFKGQFPADFPYAVPAFGASAVASISGGIVSSITILSGGQGYRFSPMVSLANAQGDTTGSGATATASVSNGQVSGITITAAGSNYTQPPLVSFSGGAGDPTDATRVLDYEVSGAITDAQFNINPGLFPNTALFQRAFLYLAAHQLVERILMRQQGIASQYGWLTSYKSVGGVNQAFIIPDMIKDNPFLANLSRTRYGAMYCQIISPLLVGNVFASPRATLP